jgi:hypothetical protein
LSPSKGNAVAEVVQQLLARAQSQQFRLERRKEKRFPYPYLVALTPVNRHDLSPIGDVVSVIGKHISPSGFGFFHQKPLPYQHMILSVPDLGTTEMGLLIRLRWCRFLQDSWFESGGQLIKLVTPWPYPGRQIAHPGDLE